MTCFWSILTSIFETKENNTLAFFNVNVNKKFQISVYCKPILSRLTIKYDTFIPHIYKGNLAETLFDRDYKISSSYFIFGLPKKQFWTSTIFSHWKYCTETSHFRISTSSHGQVNCTKGISINQVTIFGRKVTGGGEKNQLQKLILNRFLIVITKLGLSSQWKDILDIFDHRWYKKCNWGF